MNLLSVHKPDNCALLIGIPSTMHDYKMYQDGGLQSDFLKSCCQSSLKFYNEVCEPIKSCLPDIIKYGCNVYTTIEENEIKNAFSQQVVILFSHWENDNFEIRGKMISNEQLCELIPNGFSGIIDLCACQPEDNLVVYIKRRAPKAVIKCTLTRITPSIWIEIIKLTLFILYKYKMSYNEALTMTLAQINKSAHSKI